jgi:hypothetical protein
MTGYLDHILSRESPGRPHDRQKDFIHINAIPNDAAKMDRMRQRGGRLLRTLPLGNKTTVGHLQRPRAGKSNDRKTTLPDGRSDGGYGVIEHWKCDDLYEASSPRSSRLCG